MKNYILFLTSFFLVCSVESYSSVPQQDSSPKSGNFVKLPLNPDLHLRIQESDCTNIYDDEVEKGSLCVTISISNDLEEAICIPQTQLPPDDTDGIFTHGFTLKDARNDIPVDTNLMHEFHLPVNFLYSRVMIVIPPKAKFEWDYDLSTMYPLNDNNNYKFLVAVDGFKCALIKAEGAQYFPLTDEIILPRK